MNTFLSKEELLINSNTNWTVEKRPLFDADNNPASGYGIYRSDNNTCLGLVGDRYTVSQNSEILDLLYEATSQLNINAQSGGFLEKGKKVYYQFPISSVKIGNSETQRYITALTSHDGSSPIGFGATNVNVYCSNTFFKALSNLSKVKHTTTYRDKLDSIVENLRNSLLEEEGIITNLQKLSKVEIGSNINDDFLMSILGGDIESTRSKNRLDVLKSAINVEESIHGSNMFAVFNGITRFTNHLMNYKDVDSKRKSIVYGTGYEINNRGYGLLTNNFLSESHNEDVFADFLADF